jgi:hypothetical protein
MPEATADAITSISRFVPRWPKADIARFLMEEAAYAIEDYISAKKAAGWSDAGIQRHCFDGMAFRFEYVPCTDIVSRRAMQHEKEHGESSEAIECLLESVQPRLPEIARAPERHP